jgi:replicative DNA helicase
VTQRSVEEARQRQSAGGRVPPHNLDAEESLLGAMMLSQAALSEGLEIVGADDFYKPAHAHVFGAMAKLYGANEPVDALTITAELRRVDLLDAIGGTDKLLDFQQRTPAISNAAAYARIIKDHALLRRMIGVAGEIADIGYDLPDDVATTLDRAEALLFEVANTTRRRAAASRISDLLGGWLDDMEHRFANDLDFSGTPTGWFDLDHLLLGLQGGQLITLAGRPGMGKSQWAGSLAMNVAAEGRPALFFSLEMSRHELMGRFMAAAAKVDLTRIRSGRTVENDWPRISNAAGRLADMPMFLVDDAMATLLSIRGEARRTLASQGSLGVVIVDYVQLINAASRAENRQVEVAEMTRGLKRMALELDVPVVALAQLNRNLEYRKDKRPQLADLRESGAIENDSDVVLMLYRDEYYDPDSDDNGVAEVIVAKQRNGPLGTVRLGYLPMYGIFANLAHGGGL